MDRIPFTKQQIENNGRLDDLRRALRNEAAGYSRWTRARRARGHGGPEVLVTVEVKLEESSRSDGFTAMLLLASSATGKHAISEPFDRIEEVEQALKRFRAHFDGFLADQPVALPKSGERIAFRRGMYGAWNGKVERLAVPKRPEHERYVRVLFRKRNGAEGGFRACWSEIEPGWK